MVAKAQMHEKPRLLAVVGDKVGDPFKYTAGPSQNTMITVMSLVSSVFAPLIATVALFA